MPHSYRANIEGCAEHLRAHMHVVLAERTIQPTSKHLVFTIMQTSNDVS